jgi:hypothetical protein
MNDSRELKALSLLSGIDESFVDEARNAEKIALIQRTKRFPLMLAAVITVLVVSAVSVTAAVQGYISHKKNVEHNYQFVEDSSFVSELEKRQCQPIVAQNKHLRLTVDSVMSDKVYIECHATLEGLDEQGRQYISKYLLLNKSDFEKSNGRVHSFVPFMKTKGADGKDKYFNQDADLMYGKEDENAEGSFVFGTRKEAFGNAETITVDCYDWESVDVQENKGLDDLREGIFDGMSFELSLKPNYDTLVLRADNDKYSQYFYISEIRMYSEQKGFDSPSVKINYKNGSSEEINAWNMTSEIRHFDISSIKSVEYKGREYLPAETVKADAGV